MPLILTCDSLSFVVFTGSTCVLGGCGVRESDGWSGRCQDWAARKNGVRLQFRLVPDRLDVQIDVCSTLLLAVIKQKSEVLFNGDDVTEVFLARKAV